jgi:hypothetical protein
MSSWPGAMGTAWNQTADRLMNSNSSSSKMGFSWNPPASFAAASDTETSAFTVSLVLGALVVVLLVVLQPVTQIASAAARASAKGLFFMVCSSLIKSEMVLFQTAVAA